jgi:nitroimidazol reductase NimA-like FMN-containing flavoprotein (pyridoxamine 5'-phosphate oxidase superfamily)
VLATDAGGRPYTTIVGFVPVGDLRHLYFVTTRATRKYAALTGNSKVAMLIDNRSNSYRDFRDAVAVTVLGEAEEVDKQDHPDILTQYLSRHPHLCEFVSSPTSALIRVSVDTYIVVTRFQNVMTLRIKE